MEKCLDSGMDIWVPGLRLLEESLDLVDLRHRAYGPSARIYLGWLVGLLSQKIFQVGFSV